MPDYPVNLRRKAHIQHPVSFIQDQNADIVHPDISLLYMVIQSSGSCDYYPRTIPYREQLSSHILAANYHCSAYPEKRCKF